MSETYRAKVRMYRHGLGDCFLIALPRSDGTTPYFIMIDCGVILGTQNPETKMKAVVDDIAKATGAGAGTKGRVDLLIATHEHWDHLSGFIQAQDSWRTSSSARCGWRGRKTRTTRKQNA